MSAPVTVVVQARQSSRRLPGKVLAPLAGQPSLLRMLERVARVRHATRVVVATSTEASDDPVAELAARASVAVVRGSLADVLGRFVAAVPSDEGAVVRLTGDCPLVDPELVDAHIERFLSEPELEYASNAVKRTYPDGLDVEVMSAAVLHRAHREATSEYDREHVTPWIQRHVTDGRMAHLTQSIDLSALRWTLDTAADLAFIAGVYDALWPAKRAFRSADVYRLLCDEPGRIQVAGAELDDAARARWVERIGAVLGERSAEAGE